MATLRSKKVGTLAPRYMHANGRPGLSLHLSDPGPFSSEFGSQPHNQLSDHDQPKGKTIIPQLAFEVGEA